MSSQYRRADCESTKNVGGDKPVDPQSGPAGVSLGFKVEPEHAYLGHFRQEKFLRAGHNEITTERPVAGGPDVGSGGDPVLSTPFPPPVTPTPAASAAPSISFGAAPRRAVTLAGTAQNTAGRGLASRAIRSGDMATAAARPVLAARLAAKAAGLGGAERRALVSAARLDPNSRMMERRARRMK